LAKAHAIVFNTGLYYEALEKWDDVPVGQATYENFCKHMIDAQTKLNNKKTSKQQGYGLAVEQIQEITENFCHLVSLERNEKENDRATINLLRQEMSAMRTLIEQMQQKTTKQPHNGPRRSFVDHGSYCWTHGFSVTKNHTSQNCHTKGPGHKDDATRENTMGGNQRENNNRDKQGRSVNSTTLTL
jgi:hypothetical protein